MNVLPLLHQVLPLRSQMLTYILTVFRPADSHWLIRVSQRVCAVDFIEVLVRIYHNLEAIRGCLKTVNFVEAKCEARGYGIQSVKELLRLYNQAYHLIKENVCVYDYNPPGEAHFETWIGLEIGILVDLLAELQEKESRSPPKKSRSLH